MACRVALMMVLLIAVSTLCSCSGSSPFGGSAPLIAPPDNHPLAFDGLTTTTWTGGGGENWNTAGSWSNGIPTSTADAIIPLGATPYPKISSGDGAAFCCNLSLETGADLEFSFGSLSVYGDADIDGTVTNGAQGALGFLGDGPQSLTGSISALTILAMTVNKPTGELSCSLADLTAGTLLLRSPFAAGSGTYHITSQLLQWPDGDIDPGTSTFSYELASSFGSLVRGPFYNLSIDMGASQEMWCHNITPVQNDFTLVNGICKILDGNSLLCEGANFDTAAGTEFVIEAGGTLGLGKAGLCTATIDGDLRLTGAAGNLAAVTQAGAGGSAAITVDGVFEASNFTCKHLAAAGLVLTANTVIDDLSDGSFDYPSASGILLDLSNVLTSQYDASLLVGGVPYLDNVGFFNSDNAASASNVRSNGTTQNVTFRDWFGAFGGEDFDDDDTFDTIDWIDPAARTFSDARLADQNPINNPVLSGERLRMRLDPSDNFMGDDGGMGGGCCLTALTPGFSDAALYQDTFGSVSLHNGNFLHTRVVHNTPGRGFDFNLTFTYSAKHAADTTTPLGDGWDHNYNARIEKNGTVWTLHNGFRQDIDFVQIGSSNYYEGQDGCYSMLHEGTSQVTIRNRFGMKMYFAVPSKRQQFEAEQPGLPGIENLGPGITSAKLIKIADRNGNNITFTYTGSVMTGATDTFLRNYTFGYTGSRLTSLTDFVGRVVDFTYDGNNRLFSIARPEDTGGSTGQVFTDAAGTRKETQFEYYTSGVRNGKLKTITQPNEVINGGSPLVEVVYYDSGNFIGWVQSLEFGRQNYADMSAQAASIQYSYNGPVTHVRDRAGHLADYTFNADGRADSLFETADGGGGYTTTTTYNAFGEVASVTHPRGNSLAQTFDDGSPDFLYNTGNLLTRVYDAGTIASDQTTITHTWTWEPVYNGVHTYTDPRGNVTEHVRDFQEADLPGASLMVELLNQFPASQIDGALSNAGVMDNLGDINGDGTTTQAEGNRIGVVYETVTLTDWFPSGTDTLYDIEGDAMQLAGDSWTYNDYGQTTSHVNAEENVTFYSYFDSSDPVNQGMTGRTANGGGYLAATVRDVPYPHPEISALVLRSTSVNYFGDIGRNSNFPQQVDEVEGIGEFEYNDAGKTITYVNPRGVAIDYERSPLDHIIVVKAATAVEPTGRGGGESNEDEIQDSEHLGGPLNYDTEIFYDYNDNVVAVHVENSDSDTTDSNLGAPGSFSMALTVPGGTGKIESYRQHDIFDNRVGTARELGASVGEMGVTTVLYDLNENPELTTYPEGNEDAAAYDSRDLMVSQTRGLGAMEEATVQMLYDGNRNLTQFLDAEGADPTTYAFDGFERLRLVSDAVGTATWTVYDAASNVVESRVEGSPGGLAGTELLARTTIAYDERNRPFEAVEDLFVDPVTDAALVRAAVLDGTTVTTRQDFDRLGRVVYTIEEDGDVDENRYDGRSRLVRKLDVSCDCANEVEFFYDDNDNLVRRVETDRPTEMLPFTAPSDQVFTFHTKFDQLNRVEWTATPDAAGGNLWYITYFRYDSRNNVRDMADANSIGNGTVNRTTLLTPLVGNLKGNVTHYEYDPGSRLIETRRILVDGGVTDGMNTWTPMEHTSEAGDGFITTTQAWDRNSRLVSQTDDNLNETAYAYDDLNRLTTTTTADLLFETLVYDRDSNVTQRTDNAGNVFAMDYDGINRLTARSVTALAAGVLALSTEQRFEYDGLGRTTRATDSTDDDLNDTDDNTVCIYRYNSRSQLLEEEQLVHGEAGLAVSSRYVDEQDRSRLIYPDNSFADYTYDDKDRIATIAFDSVNVATYWYLGSRVLERSYNNGTKLRFHDGAGGVTGYDPARRVTGLKNLDSSNAEFTPTTLSRDYQYDRVHNRTRVQRDGTMDEDLIGYDSAYRMLSFDRTGDPAVSWDIDGANNWTSSNFGGTTQTYVADEMNQYTAIGGTSPVHDDNGNLTDDGTLTYEYDAYNRLRQVSDTGGTIEVYDYDASGRRVRRNSLGVEPTVHYYYDGIHCIEERDASDNSLLRQYVYGRSIDEVLCLVDGGTTRYYYHADVQGSIVGLTDAAQNVEATIEYDAYGGPTISGNAHGNTLMYTGRRFDTLTGLYYYRARMYDPKTGRFLQREPFGIWYDFSNYGNAFAYVGNGPASWVDVLGLEKNAVIFVGLPLPGSDNGGIKGKVGVGKGQVGENVTEKVINSLTEHFANQGYEVCVCRGEEATSEKLKEIILDEGIEALAYFGHAEVGSPLLESGGLNDMDLYEALQEIGKETAGKKEAVFIACEIGKEDPTTSEFTGGRTFPELVSDNSIAPKDRIKSSDALRIANDLRNTKGEDIKSVNTGQYALTALADTVDRFVKWVFGK